MGIEHVVITTHIYDSFEWPSWFIKEWGEILHFEIQKNEKSFGNISTKGAYKINYDTLIEDIRKASCVLYSLKDRYNKNQSNDFSQEGIHVYVICESFTNHINLYVIERDGSIKNYDFDMRKNNE